MHIIKVNFIILMLMNSLWAITHNEEGKVIPITSTSVGRQNINKKSSEQSEKLLKINNNDSNDSEDKKTLAQQVADGKYGLIQKELFSKPVKRPGILSYEVNPEVPKDNVNNLGGLMPEEIWLAENHLLVLKGGNLGGEGKWPAIDNYVAPRRQVKIPQNPRIPPPFPVQLTDDGPTQFIKSKNNSGQLFKGFYPGNDTYPGNLNAGNGYEPFPFLLPLPPPVAAFLPGNVTELDEDDPSIYYPPPYDFVYPKDNSSFVAAGPIVPGIVVPPPPNFFSLLDKKPVNNKINNTRLRPIRPPQRKTTTNMPKVSTTTSATTITSSKPTKITTTIRITTTYKRGKSGKFASSSPPPASTISPNEIVNTLPPNTPVGDWVPIPAPRPFYITLKPYEIEEAKHQPGWKLFNKTDNKKHNFIDKYYSNFKPIFKQNPLPLYIDSQKNNFVYYQSQFNPTLTRSGVHTKSPQKLNTINYFQSPIDYYLQEKFKANNQKKLTTKKPPIYEYSYSAPGYGTIEAPKIGTNFYDVSTSRPYDYNLYRQTDYPSVSTSRPYDYNLYGQTDYSAEIPYNQRTNNYDDNTKKYFTLFGQKLNEALTTASPHVKYRSSPTSLSSVSDARSVESSRQNYNIQNDYSLINNQYYPDRIYYRNGLNGPISYGSGTITSTNSNTRPIPSARPIHHQYDDYEEQSSIIPHSLHSDIAVNYKQPLPPINPHAEYIEPYSTQSKSSQRAPPSLISYQLPGTAGHFYFLTPQAE